MNIYTMILKIFLQFLVFLVYMVFLFRYVRIAKAGRKYIKDITTVGCVPDSKNNGKIVHINCRLDKGVINYVGKEFWSNIYSHNGIFIETKVEMFQWVQSERMTGKFYKGEFVDHLVPGNIFYKNPNFIPYVSGSGRVYAKQIKIGGYVIGREWFVNLNSKAKLKIVDDEWYEPSNSVPPIEVNNLNTQVFNDSLYTGDIINPKIGDIKITFYGSEDVEFSAIGKQTSSLLGEYQLKPVEFLNKKMVLVAPKYYDKQELQDHIYSQISKINIEIIRIVLILLLTALVYEEIKSEKSKVCVIVCSGTVSGIIVYMTQAIIWSVNKIQKSIIPVIVSLKLFLILIVAWKLDEFIKKTMEGNENFIKSNKSFDSVLWREESKTNDSDLNTEA